jgi:hypothetical protein
MGSESGSRLDAAAAGLLARQLESGAWGQRANAERGNTIATAQALRVLRRAGIPGWHDAVRRAFDYLGESALDHAKEIDQGGRGSYVRYVIHSLGGLLEYLDGVAGTETAEARDRQLTWLLQRQTYGGWPDSPADPISSLATAQALQVIRRAQGPSEAVEAARDYLLSVRNPRGYWGMKEWGPGSPAVTAECMIALRGLSAEADAAAEGSARWLEGSRRLWLRQVERHPITGETWQLASFASVSLALAPFGSGANGLSATLEYVEEHWDPDGPGWRFPGETEASPKGAVAAISCFEAVLGARPLDRAAAALVPSGMTMVDGGTDSWSIELRERPDVLVRVDGAERRVPLRPRLWDLLDALEREADGQLGGFPLRERVAAAMGLSPRALSKELTRLNERLATATDGRLSRVVTAAGRGRCRLTGEVRRPAAPERPDSGAPTPVGQQAAGG